MYLTDVCDEILQTQLHSTIAYTCYDNARTTVKTMKNLLELLPWHMVFIDPSVDWLIGE